MRLLTSFPLFLMGIVLIISSAQARIMWSPTVHAPDNIAGSVAGNDWYKFANAATVHPEHIFNSITEHQRLVFEAQLNGASSYAGMGFSWKSNSTDTNITAAAGVCFTYRAARPFRLNLVQYQSPNEDHYGKEIPAQNAYAALFVPFSELKREGWGSNYAFNAAKQQGFNIQYKAGIAKSGKDSSNTIEILQVGLGDVCDASNTPAAGTLTTSSGPFWDALSSAPARAANLFGGTWQSYSEGISTVTPAAGSTAAMDAKLASTGSVGFEANLKVTAANPYPYAGISLYWRESSALADISAQNGLCVTYRSEQPVRLILEQDGQTHTNYHGASLPAQTRYQARNIAFTAFAQETSWGYKTVLDLQRQKTLRFEYKNSVTSSNSLEILQVGFQGQCDDAKFAPQALSPYDTLSSLHLKEGDTWSAALSRLFHDRDGDSLTYTLSNSNPSVLSAQIADGKLVLTPKANIDGTSQFGISATDPDNQVAFILFAVHVEDQELNPVAKPDHYQVWEDSVLVIADPAQGLLVNDFDGDGDAFWIISHTNPAHGSVVVDSSGTFTYTPDPDFNGTDFFSYTIEDATGRTGTALVDITVKPVNDPPVVTGAIPDQGPYEEDFTGFIPVTISRSAVVFSDPDGDSLTLGVSTNGLVSASLSTTSTDYRIILRSVPDAFGTAVVTLYANDPAGDSVGVSFQVVITPVEDEPTLVNDSYQGTEDTPLVVSAEAGVLANDLNPDRLALHATVVAAPEFGVLVLDSSGAFTYVPDADWHGTDQFSYRLSSAEKDFPGEGVVTLVIAAVNDAPALKAGATLADIDTVEDFSAAIRIPLHGLYLDVDGDALQFWAGSTPEVKVSIDTKTQELVIRSVTNANGVATVRVTATDGKLASADTLVFLVTIAAVNDAPVVRTTIPAQNLPLTGWKLGFALDSVFSDPDGDPLVYTFACPEGLSCEMIGDSLYVQPESAPAGLYTVRVTATDPDQASRTTTFRITLTETTSVLASGNPAVHWQQLFETGSGQAFLVDSRGRVLQRFALPAALHSLQEAQRAQPIGNYYLRMGQGTWKLPALE